MRHSSPNIRAGAAGLALGALLALVLIAGDMRDEFTTTFTPGRLNRFVDPLYPPGRFDPPIDGVQRMKAEPGYTDILVPHGYRKMFVSLRFDNPGEQEFSVGLRREGNPDLATVPVEASTAGLFETTLELSAADENADGRVSFIMSAPEMRSEHPESIMIRSLTVRFEDPIWSDRSLVQRIIWYLRML